MEKNTWLWLLAGAGVLWYFSQQNNAQAAATPVTASPTPLSSGNTSPVVVTTDPSTNTTTATDVNGNAVPTTYGLNPNNAKSPTNYNVLAIANPNLLNPNYQLQPNEISQYLLNYADLRRNGIDASNAQNHWSWYGQAEGRIFLPMVPVSTF